MLQLQQLQTQAQPQLHLYELQPQAQHQFLQLQHQLLQLKQLQPQAQERFLQVQQLQLQAQQLFARQSQRSLLPSSAPLPPQQQTHAQQLMHPQHLQPLALQLPSSSPPQMLSSSLTLTPPDQQPSTPSIDTNTLTVVWLGRIVLDVLCRTRSFAAQVKVTEATAHVQEQGHGASLTAASVNGPDAQIARADLPNNTRPRPTRDEPALRGDEFVPAKRHDGHGLAKWIDTSPRRCTYAKIPRETLLREVGRLAIVTTWNPTEIYLVRFERERQVPRSLAS